ncbi:MAG: hypothetical protein EB084_19555 [Proteobacteria bacterium]|nr:hypothetical protein [Pseudomonadota bacterium]
MVHFVPLTAPSRAASAVLSTPAIATAPTVVTARSATPVVVPPVTAATAPPATAAVVVAPVAAAPTIIPVAPVPAAAPAVVVSPVAPVPAAAPAVVVSPVAVAPSVTAAAASPATPPVAEPPAPSQTARAVTLVVPSRDAGASTPATSALAASAWSVLKTALTEETLSGTFADFREGAGGRALAQLDGGAFMAVMRDLCTSPEPAVRRRVVATMARIDNVGASRILHQALGDTALPVRMEAAAILGSRGDRAVIDTFRQALAARGHDDRFLVLTAMKRVDKKWMVPLLAPFLSDRDPFMRVAAAEGLARLGDEKAWMALRRSTASTDKYLRSSAYAAVQDVGGRRGTSVLADALRDKDPGIRLYAAVYLARIGDASGLAALQGAMRQTNAALRFTAIDALCHLDGEEVLQTLVRALGDSDAEVRVRAAAGLFAHKKGNGIPALQAALASDVTAVRLKAVEAAKLGCPGPGVPLLVSALGDHTRSVRLAALDALASVTDVRDREALRRSLADADAGVRVACALELARLDDAAGLQALSRFTAPGNPERDEMLRAADRVKLTAVSAALSSIASSGPSDDRTRAVDALGRQGTAASAEALCAIACANADPVLSPLAVQALSRIDSDLSTYLLKGLLAEGMPAAVRLEAAAALGDRGVEAAGPVLRGAHADDLRAARALCKIGDPAGSTTYQKMLGSSSLSERLEAAVVLLRLQSKAPLGVE